MKSDLNLLQIDDSAVDVTSRHVTFDHHNVAFDVRHVTSRPRTLRRIDVVDVALRHVSLCWRRRRVDTSSRHHDHFPEINRLEKYHMFIEFFEIAFFLKLINFKSAFKLPVSNPGRKLWPILFYCILKANKLF